MARCLRWLPVAIVPALFVLASELKHYRLQEIQEAMATLPWGHLAAAVALTVASYSVLACYDWFGLRYAG